MVVFTSFMEVQVLIKRAGAIAQLLLVQQVSEWRWTHKCKHKVWCILTRKGLNKSRGLRSPEGKGKAYCIPEIHRVDFAGTFAIFKLSKQTEFRHQPLLQGERICVHSVWEMKCSTCLYYCWGFLAVAVFPVSAGEIYTSLLNVKQAISVERRLIDYLRIYIDHELERLNDIKRWVERMMLIFVICMSEILLLLICLLCVKGAKDCNPKLPVEIQDKSSCDKVAIMLFDHHE